MQKLTGEPIQYWGQERLDLGKVCGHVPLAIKLMARVISEDKVLPRDIISDIATSNILDVIDVEDWPEEFSMQKVIEFSFSRLSVDKQKMFISLTVFPGSFDAEAAAAVVTKGKIFGSTCKEIIS